VREGRVGEKREKRGLPPRSLGLLCIVELVDDVDCIGRLTAEVIEELALLFEMLDKMLTCLRFGSVVVNLRQARADEMILKLVESESVDGV